jgi:hypothetical protein
VTAHAVALALAMTSPLGPLDARSHEIVLGVPGSGKTTLARERVATVRRLVVFDPARDYSAEGERMSADDLAADPCALEGTFRRVVVEPEGDDTADQFMRTVAACREQAPRHGPLVLLADEVGDYAPRAAGALTRLHRNAHHDGVASILVSQCAVDVPLTCRRTATRVTSLLQVASGDLDALAREYGEAFASAVGSWRPGAPPVVWTLPTLHRK